MLYRPALVVLLAGILASGVCPRVVDAQQPTSLFPPGSVVPGRGALPNPDAVLALADTYLADAGKHADQEDLRIFQQVQLRLRKLELQPDSVMMAISGLVTQLTVSLGGGQSLAGITMLSAFLVKLDPHNPRVTNLFGAVLHSGGRLRDASEALELSVKQSANQPNGGLLARLNLANVYIDRDLDAKAKVLLDTMIKRNPDDKNAWSVMALYWFKRGNYKEQQTALLRASSGGVGLIKRAIAPVDAVVTKNEVQPGDAIDAMEQKLAELSKVRPLTTADIIERVDPLLAQKIRKEAHTPLPDQLWKLPLFPQVNTQDNRGYIVGMPIIDEWLKWFAMQYADQMKAEALAKVGITVPKGEGPLSDADSARIDARARPSPPRRWPRPCSRRRTP